MSIGKTQADLLAESFLDDIGADKDGFQPKETLSAFFQLAGLLIIRAQQYLNNDRSNASGKLSESIQLEEPITGDGFIQQDVSMNFYGRFINEGVRGTKGGSGAYKFKNDYISKKMLKAFKEYKNSSKSKTGTEKKGIGKTEQKYLDASGGNAWLHARTVKRYGIKATHFMDKAVDDIDEIVEKNFEEALTIDVINSIPDTL